MERRTFWGSRRARVGGWWRWRRGSVRRTPLAYTDASSTLRARPSPAAMRKLIPGSTIWLSWSPRGSEEPPGRASSGCFALHYVWSRPCAHSCGQHCLLVGSHGGMVLSVRAIELLFIWLLLPLQRTVHS